MGSWKGRGNQYIQLVRVLYCKLPTDGKQLPAFPLEAVSRIEPRPQRWEARVLPLCHRGPYIDSISMCHTVLVDINHHIVKPVKDVVQSQIVICHPYSGNTRQCLPTMDN